VHPAGRLRGMGCQMIILVPITNPSQVDLASASLVGYSIIGSRGGEYFAVNINEVDRMKVGEKEAMFGNTSAGLQRSILAGVLFSIAFIALMPHFIGVSA
jgi:hypothetical protein